MRSIVGAMALGVSLLALPLQGAMAQQRSLEETLGFINETLEANPYNDHDGKLTVSRVELKRGGRLSFEVAKKEPASTVSNVFEASIADIDVTSIVSRSSGNHMVIVVHARGPVSAQLKCVAGGNVTQWDLPPRSDMQLEFRSNGGVAGELTEALRTLVTLARQDARYS